MKKILILLLIFNISCSYSDQEISKNTEWVVDNVAIENDSLILLSKTNKVKIANNQIVEFSFALDSVNENLLVLNKIIFKPGKEQMNNVILKDNDKVVVNFNNSIKLDLSNVIQNKDSITSVK